MRFLNLLYSMNAVNTLALIEKNYGNTLNFVVAVNYVFFPKAHWRFVKKYESDLDVPERS